MLNYKNIRKRIGHKYYYLPKKMAHNLLFKNKFGRNINWKNPTLYSEKLHYLLATLYGKKEAYYADKINVRDYIIQQGYEDILPNVYGIWKNVNEIKENDLPNKFVLKTNHGCGTAYYSICQNKDTFDWKNELNKLNESLKINYAKSHCEYHYKYIKPKVYAEEYLEQEGYVRPLDYKLYCFDGKVEVILVCTDRESSTKFNYYDKEWNKLDIVKEKYKSDKIIDKPNNLNELISIAENLSKPFKFARMDFYYINDKIYFSEITLSPSGGDESDFTMEAQEWLGSLLHI